jgi:hypothetical protein
LRKTAAQRQKQRKEIMEKKIKLARNLELAVNDNTGFGAGFTLWYNGKWLIDASCLTHDKQIRVSLDLVLGKPDKDYGGISCLTYRIKKRGEAKSSPVTVRAKKPRTTNGFKP